MSRLVLCTAFVLLVVATGCTTGNGVRTSGAPPTDEERILIARICRDPFVDIAATERTSDGRLMVITRQGAVIRRYLLAPDVVGAKELRIRRVADEVVMDTTAPAHAGLEPDLNRPR